MKSWIPGPKPWHRVPRNLRCLISLILTLEPVTSIDNGQFHFEVYDMLAISEYGTMFLGTVEASTVLGSVWKVAFLRF